MEDTIEPNESVDGKSKIEQFLLDRGFEYGTGANEKGLMRFIQPVFSNRLWFIYFEDHLLVCQYNENNEIINPSRFDFKTGDFDDFISIYRSSVQLIIDYFTVNKNIIIGGEF